MKGMLYGVGVGPGDPELMTLKAVRLIKENEVIAVPGTEAKDSLAYRIAVQAVPELAEKILLTFEMPMTHDPAVQDRAHTQAADGIEACLRQGKNVVYLTLGDPTIYSTYLYVQKKIEARGYETLLVSGIPSFCAAAARANMPLAERNEQIHIISAGHYAENPLDLPGSYVLMKSGRKLGKVRKQLIESGRDAVMVENCGLENEKIYRGAEEIPEESGYFSLIIAKEKKNV